MDLEIHHPVQPENQLEVQREVAHGLSVLLKCAKSSSWRSQQSNKIRGPTINSAMLSARTVPTPYMNWWLRKWYCLHYRLISRARFHVRICSCWCELKPRNYFTTHR